MGDTLPEGFTTEIRAVAGYDHRDDIKDRRGCAGLSLIFVLRGPLGAITWELMTGLMRRPIADPGWSIYANRVPKRSGHPGWDDVGHDSPHPTVGPIASHCHEARHDYWAGPYPCDVLGGQCYGDVGYMVGDQAMEALLTGGQDAVFGVLREFHDEWLGPETEVAP